MEIWNCEYCNAYLTNFEVHNCANFGHQHRQSYATLPQCSSGNRTQYIDVRTQQMHYEERMPSMNQAYSSRQHSILPNMHQRTDCEGAAAAEMPSQYLIANQNTFNPVTSEFQFPDMARGKENQFKSTHFQQPFEANTLILNQNPRCGEASNSKYPANAPLPVAEPWCLPAFQQTFGQRNAMANQIFYPNESSQTEGSGVSSHFASDFNETDNASTNQISQQYGTSLAIGILANENAQYNPMDTIPPTISHDSSNNPFQRKYDLEPQDRSRSVAKPYVCNFCGKSFSSRYHLTDHIHTHKGEKPHACRVCNRCFAARSNLRDHMHIHTGRPYKCTECCECFFTRYRLQEHVRIIHDGQNSYECTQCDKCFARSSSLRRHVLSIHTGDRPYRCTECGQCFAHSSTLRRHVRNIHADD